MKLSKQRRSWLLLGPMLAAGAAAQAAQYTPSQIPVPAGSTFRPSPSYYLDPNLPFEGSTYFRGVKTTSGGVGSYTFDASNKSSNVPGTSGANKTLTWYADATHAFTVSGGIWDLNFKGTATGTNPGTAIAGCSFAQCSVQVTGTGITGSAADIAWLQTNKPSVWTALAPGASRNLFSASLTAFDLFGESTSSTTDDAIAFKWTGATGALATFADPFNFLYLGNVKTSNFFGSKTTYTTTNAIQHTNVPVPAAVYLFGSALLFLRRRALGSVASLA